MQYDGSVGGRSRQQPSSDNRMMIPPSVVVIASCSETYDIYLYMYISACLLYTSDAADE